MIFVTILFVAIAYNGYAHHRQQKRHKEVQKCMCEKQRPERPSMNKENFEGRKGQNRPNNDGKFNHQRKGRPDFKKESTIIKDTMNGKIAMVTVGSPLTPFETELLMGE